MHQIGKYTNVHHIRLAYHGVATISRLLKIIRLFCRISSLLQSSFAKETYNLKEPTNRGHPMIVYVHTTTRRSSVYVRNTQRSSVVTTTQLNCHHNAAPSSPRRSSVVTRHAGMYTCVQTFLHVRYMLRRSEGAIHCNTLQHTATHCNMLQGMYTSSPSGNISTYMASFKIRIHMCTHNAKICAYMCTYAVELYVYVYSGNTRSNTCMYSWRKCGD